MLGIWLLGPNSRLGVSPSKQVREPSQVTELAGGQAGMPVGVWPRSWPSPSPQPVRGASFSRCHSLFSRTFL